MSPVYPCHILPRDMRTHPIGTGPFKFVEYKPNEYIKLTKNPDYWKQGRPYLDGIEWTIIPNRSTQTLAFIAGKFDMTFPYEATVQSMRDIKSQAPDAICELTPTIVAINLLLNRDAPPFDNPEIRRAMQLTIDRKSFIDILAEGQGDISGAMPPPPGGLWGLPPEILQTLTGYGLDVAANRAEARKLMERHGYGPDKRLAVKVATRNIPQFRDPALIMIDQMKQIYIDGELEVVETANWYPKVARKDYMVGTNLCLPRPVRLCRPRLSLWPAHPRKTWASRRKQPNSRERQTACWSKPDSNSRSHLRRCRCEAQEYGRRPTRPHYRRPRSDN